MSLTSIEAAIGSIGRLGSSAPVVLGSVTLTGMEVPDALEIGGKQQLVVQFMIGGALNIQALGNDPGQLPLTGRFIGPNAQARAEAIANMRRAGKAITFSAAGLAVKVKIAEFRYSFTLKGAVCPYTLILQRGPEATSSSSTSSSFLSSLIGSDAAAAVTTATDTVSSVASAVENTVGQIGTVAGQITPLANLVGAGSVMGSITSRLSAVTSLSNAATNLSSAPSSVATMGQSLYETGSGLSDTLSQAGDNLEHISLTSGSGLTAALQNANISTSAADALSSVNRASVNLGAATDTTVNRALS
ncbi:hypothetical protein [Acetobacter sicerae]|uniref:hypothetical protein n=1 Tax=Acetobacter sicerae TaxID=85325 RepID=UPI00156B78AD|nr:hypothetical protein [Acetobacter sicerae]NHN93630.1 hypothetical protein [Acetobacter sicerae]